MSQATLKANSISAEPCRKINPNPPRAGGVHGERQKPRTPAQEFPVRWVHWRHPGHVPRTCLGKGPIQSGRSSRRSVSTALSGKTLSPISREPLSLLALIEGPENLCRLSGCHAWDEPAFTRCNPPMQLGSPDTSIEASRPATRGIVAADAVLNRPDQRIEHQSLHPSR